MCEKWSDRVSFFCFYWSWSWPFPNNLKQVLEDEGVKKIEVKIGDKPDPKYHHELQRDYDENYEEGVILQELQSGYMYKDRILRPTLVKVNKKEEGKENE